MRLPDWISVKEQKPKYNQLVLVCSIHRNGLYSYTLSRYRGRRFMRYEVAFVHTEIVSCVKYWQPASGWIEKDDNGTENN